SSRGRPRAIPSRWPHAGRKGGTQRGAAGAGLRQAASRPRRAAPAAVASARPRGSLLPRLQSPRSAVPRPRPPPFSLFSSPPSPAKLRSPRAGRKRARRLAEAVKSGRTSRPENRAGQRFGERRARGTRDGKTSERGTPEMGINSRGKTGRRRIGEKKLASKTRRKGGPKRNGKRPGSLSLSLQPLRSVCETRPGLAGAPKAGEDTWWFEVFEHGSCSSLCPTGDFCALSSPKRTHPRMHSRFKPSPQPESSSSNPSLPVAGCGVGPSLRSYF
ncbi:PREDICTED: translation initiation factor IF-2-like, partial [Chinchilla lanigera]|uniref:translation initiation factor IF-2-like n=1 Tax=Chinchilla lanigera TaxID=34839 RepID=UPI00069632E0